MNLQTLDKEQLKTLFLGINSQYLKIIEAPIATYMNSTAFLDLRKQLQELMEELERRRSVDPPLLHENSPSGIEPDSLFNRASFLSDME